MSKLAIALAVGVAACGAHPPSAATQRSLQDQASLTLDEMRARDPSLDPLLAAFAGYVVFPEIGAAGGVVAGGAFGRGILYEHGRPAGYVELQQGSIGPQLGGQTYAELVIVQDQLDVDFLKAGTFDLGADASAVVLTKGVAASARFNRGTSVFVMPRGGLMAGVAVSGQRIYYQPLG